LFDGVKINCCSTDWREWLAHPDLEFIGEHVVRTGEELPTSKRVKFREMLFRVTPSRAQPGQAWCYAEGSLHRYALDGAPNVGNFPFEQMRDTVAGLCERFGIDPARALLESIEFGLNIALPVPARQFLKTLVCHGCAPFVELNRDKRGLGMVAARQQYEFKLYDKGRQTETEETHTLRVEVKVLKMEWLKPYKIETLADLTDPAKVQPLGKVLADALGQVVAYDGSILETELSEKERLALRDFTNPKWWADLDKSTRYNKRKQCAQMLQKHGADRAFLSVVETVASQWDYLLCEAQKNCDFLTGKNTNGAQRICDFLTVRMKGQIVAKLIFTEENKKSIENQKNASIDPAADPTKAPFAKRSFFHTFCQCCGRDISAQKSGSRFCSEKLFGRPARKCRDKAHRHRQREARRMEAARLDALLPDLPGAVATLSVFALDATATDRRLLRAVTVAAPLHALAGRPFVGIRQAVRVEVSSTDGQCHTFTRSRAKRLLKFISSLKISDNESVIATDTATSRGNKPRPVLHPRMGQG